MGRSTATSAATSATRRTRRQKGALIAALPTTMMHRRLCYLLCTLVLTFSASAQAAETETSENADTKSRRLSQQPQEHLHEFAPLNKVHVLGPSSFPKPTEIAKTSHEDLVEPFLQPAIGKHRSDQDAVMCYGSEYSLKNYVLFVESLLKTGFKGDIVVIVHEGDLANPEIRAYFESVPNIVVYVPRKVCFNFENEIVESAKGGIRTCQCNDLYARKNTTTGELTPLADPRGQRTLANTRYEIYWIVVHNYNPHQWILIVDMRDTVFQTDPFEHVPRRTDASGESGLLYFFGENREATRLGKSKMNNKWLTNAYGAYVSEALQDKPTICSGATMGEQVAMETYVRAMVAEADETGTVIMGSDQGFHNRLHYSGKLIHADKIHGIVVFDQGE
jgi:hypothetical protein